MHTLRIGQVARRVGVTVKTVRFYDEMGLLPPARRTPAGYRLYSEREVARLAFIRKAVCVGLSLEEVRELLSLYDQGQPCCPQVRATIQHKVAVLRLPPHRERPLQVIGVDREPRAEGDPETTGELNGDEASYEGPEVGDFHHHRAVWVFMTQPCPRSALLLCGSKHRVRESKAHVTVMSINGASTESASGIRHEPHVATPTSKCSRISCEGAGDFQASGGSTCPAGA